MRETRKYLRDVEPCKKSKDNIQTNKVLVKLHSPELSQSTKLVVAAGSSTFKR